MIVYTVTLQLGLQFEILVTINIASEITLLLMGSGVPNKPWNEREKFLF